MCTMWPTVGTPFQAGLSMACYRMVADTSDLAHAQFILPAGNVRSFVPFFFSNSIPSSSLAFPHAWPFSATNQQSGHRGTRCYDNMIPLYLRGDLLPMHFDHAEVGPHVLFFSFILLC